MGRIYSIEKGIFYIVEERLQSNSQHVNYAWLFDSKAEAEMTLRKEVRLHGKDRLYTVYILVD